ncbi:MAG: HSP20 family protein [Chlamydiales bacterium]|jgi:HSP20 family protein
MKRNDEMAADSPALDVAQAATRQPVMRLARGADVSKLTIELPGVPAEGVELLHEGRRLALRATPVPCTPAEGMRPLCTEIEQGGFEVTLEVPPAIAMDRIEADLRDGLLVLSFPHRIPERRTIAVTGQ